MRQARRTIAGFENDRRAAAVCGGLAVGIAFGNPARLFERPCLGIAGGGLKIGHFTCFLFVPHLRGQRGDEPSPNLPCAPCKPCGHLARRPRRRGARDRQGRSHRPGRRNAADHAQCPADRTKARLCGIVGSRFARTLRLPPPRQLHGADATRPGESARHRTASTRGSRGGAALPRRRAKAARNARRP